MMPELSEQRYRSRPHLFRYRDEEGERRTRTQYIYRSVTNTSTVIDTLKIIPISSFLIGYLVRARCLTLGPFPLVDRFTPRQKGALAVYITTDFFTFSGGSIILVVALKMACRSPLNKQRRVLAAYGPSRRSICPRNARPSLFT